VVVADSSVWIDYFNAQPNPARDVLRRLLHDGDTRLVVPDLVLFEVMRGFRSEREWRQAQTLMLSLDIETSGGTAMMLDAAQHYRDLRKSGITVRNGIDVLVAAFCIERDYVLLHRDRDFDAFESLRGLRVWRH
jgi:hypothetical protein